MLKYAFVGLGKHLNEIVNDVSFNIEYKVHTLTIFQST